MSMLLRFLAVVAVLLASSLLPPLRPVLAERPSISDQDLEFFETRIRPVLVEHCYGCHNSEDSAEGGLVLDHRDGLLRGGDRGKSFIPGDPSNSRILQVIRHEIEGLEMPEGGAKLETEVLKDFESWVRRGAPDPRDRPPSAEEREAANSWDSVLERRKQWWSFQTIEAVEPPGGEASDVHPIDSFVNANLKAQGLTAAEPAETAALVRRAFVCLVGVPPAAEEAALWTGRLNGQAETGGDGFAQLIDSLLEDPRFGERWGRHWMDWIRYAESHGSEGDPRIQNAWHYRDYIIRALNQDVPYDQLVREHIAGDLLKDPRINRELGINESLIGTAHWRMVFHGFAPTDALDEKVRFVDDQINVFSKAFLGLTVSCARCHDHKFDAISQADYYALFGVLGSCRPGRNVVDLAEHQNLNREALVGLKTTIRMALADVWAERVDEIVQALMKKVNEPLEKKKLGQKRLVEVLRQVLDRASESSDFSKSWEQAVSSLPASNLQSSSWPTDPSLISHHWDLGAKDQRQVWTHTGVGTEHAGVAGDFALATEADVVLAGIYPSGVYSNAVSTKHAARLTSPDFPVASGQSLWVEVLGDGEASVRYVIHDYPRNGTVYPVSKLSDQWRWQRFDLSYWSGESAHVELSTAMDAPLLAGNRARSWFGVRKVIVADSSAGAPKESSDAVRWVMEEGISASPANESDLRQRLREMLTALFGRWRSLGESAGGVTDGEALLLDQLIREGILPNSMTADDELGPLLTEYRELENAIKVPLRVPGLEESAATDQPLMIRGNHKQLGEPVPRRFLEAINSSPFSDQNSGRLELASRVLDADNPLTKRVIVNRLWHHVFGQGLVSTPDNFGRLGSKPSHPQLLDWLAGRFERDGWSLKQMIRLMMTSDAWQRSVVPLPGHLEEDPENRSLARANTRRLEAESIRDTLLMASGRLDPSLYGPPVSAGVPRRSVYLNVIRNSLDPFLRVFDFPEPFSTVGRRDQTNVPAQSLALMNDPRVKADVVAWANRLRSRQDLSDDRERVRQLVLTAFGREPGKQEEAALLRFLDESRSRFRQSAALRSRLQDKVLSLRDENSGLLEKARSVADSESSEQKEDKPPVSVEDPIARWQFDQGLEDQIGGADLELVNSAELTPEGIRFSGGYAVSSPLKFDVAEKTLVAWVKLSDLKQRGGGVMTLQTKNGSQFDSIVFGEQQPEEWIAGSDHFRRTEALGGPKESESDEFRGDRQFLCLAVRYSLDGSIQVFRNGQIYGKSYRKGDGPVRFRADQSVVSFGIRHLPAGGNRMLSGTVRAAMLYSVALDDRQVAWVSGQTEPPITRKELLALMSTEDQSKIRENDALIRRTESELSELPQGQRSIDESAWVELVHAVVGFKEFLYVR